MQTESFFIDGDRYMFDFGDCSFKNGFSQLDTSQDSSYFGMWANPFILKIVSYCEGDVSIDTCDNDEEFIKRIKEIKAYYNDVGYSFSIDPGLSKTNIKRWKELGLSDLI